MKKLNTVPLLMLLFIIISSGQGTGQAFRGDGDFEFFLDAGSLPQRDGRIIELFQIAVPTKEIEYKKKDGSYKAAVSIYILLEADGEMIHEKHLMISDVRETAPAAHDLTGFLYISDSCSVDPGRYELSVRVEDKNRKKRTLLGALRKKYDFSSFEAAPLEVREYPPGELVLSEPFLLWGRQDDGRYIPNPIGIYGLKNDTIQFFAHAMVPDEVSLDRLGVYMMVLDDKEQTVDSVYVTYAVRDGQTSMFGVFDVNSYPAGNYRLTIETVGEGGLYASAGKDFAVVWELLNWEKPRRDVLVEARIIFNDVEYEAFQVASIGEQERILAEYWKSVDPTPHTAINETYEIFTRRVLYANRSFGDRRKGAITDRGQIYIRFGPPEEILSESIPFNRTDLEEVIDKLDDQYEVVIHNTWKGLGTEDVQLYNAARNVSTPYRGGGMDTGGYELWVYTLKGKPLFPRDKLMTIQSGLRLLFVDKDGVGNYILVGTSEEFEDPFGGGSTE